MVSLVSLKYQEALYKRLTFSPQLNQIILPINNQLTLHFHSSVTPNPRLPASDPPSRYRPRISIKPGYYHQAMLVSAAVR